MIVASLFSLYLAPQVIGELPREPISLQGGLTLAGKRFSLVPKPGALRVLVFLGVECPIANRYAPEIERICQTYGKRGVQFWRVYVEPLSYKNNILQHGKEFSLSAPALLDPEKNLVKQLGIRVTPEVVVLDGENRMRYRGRIDDRNVEHGKERKDYRRDLRISLDELLANKPVSLPSTAATGCYIGATN